MEYSLKAYNVILEADALIVFSEGDFREVELRQRAIWHDITESWTHLNTALDAIKQEGGQMPVVIIPYKNEITNMMHSRRQIYPDSLKNPSLLWHFLCGKDGSITAIQRFQNKYEELLHGRDINLFKGILEAATAKLLEDVKNAKVCTPLKGSGVAHPPTMSTDHHAVAERIVMAHLWLFKTVGVLTI